MEVLVLLSRRGQPPVGRMKRTAFLLTVRPALAPTKCPLFGSCTEDLQNLFIFCLLIYFSNTASSSWAEPVKVDRSKLPTAPRASFEREQLDLSKLPGKPPYTLFLGNLSYDVFEEDIERFFGGKVFCFCFFLSRLDKVRQQDFLLCFLYCFILGQILLAHYNG